MIRATTLLTLLVPAACAAATPPPKGQPAPPAFDEDRCDRAAAAVLIGRKAAPGLAEEAKRLSGAALVRIIRAGDPVTSDYQTSRINVDVGRDGRVADVRCG
jgi:hypothetical protein